VELVSEVVVEATVGIGISRPVAAANLICIDSGTVPALTQGRTVKVDFGRSRHQRSASTTGQRAKDRWKMVSWFRQDHLHLL
jgi:hypothetical protein